MTDQPIEVWRILDAAANRAGEGLRVVEEFTRFALNDAHLSRRLKETRHELASVLSEVPEEKRLAARDTPGDVGTVIGTASEYQRGSPLDVVRASFKRTQEAFRTLEEYGKLVNPGGFAQQIEKLRYDFYTLEKAVLRTNSAIKRLHGLTLYLLVTSENCARGLESTVRAALSAGVGIVQLREKSMADRELLALARKLRTWTSEANALFIVNDRPDLAVLADADGVHVGQDELSVRDARQIVGPSRLIGVSTHNIEQARQAVVDGADYLGVGPTFPSGTKSFNQFAGIEFVRQVASEIALPWFAIGGLNEENFAEVKRVGASRIAVSGAICQATDPHRATMALMTRD